MTQELGTSAAPEHATHQEELLALALEQLPDAVVLLDEASNVLFLNAAARRRYGPPAETAVGHPLTDVFSTRLKSAETRAALFAALARDGRWRGEVVHVCLDGREIPVESSLAVLRYAQGTRRATIGVIRDLEERQRSETQRAFLATLRQTLLEPQEPGHLLHAALPLILDHLQLNAALWCDQRREGPGRFTEEHGAEEPRLLLAGLEGHLAPDAGAPHELVVVRDVRTNPRTAATADALLARGVGAFVTVPLPRGAGSWTALTLASRRDRAWTPLEQELLREVALLLDAALERAAIEQARSESKRRFREVYESAPLGIAIHDASAHLLQCNASLERLLGYSEAELRGRDFEHFIHPEDRAAVRAAVAPVLRGDQASVALEHRAVARDGRPLWVRQYVSLSRDEGGVPQYVITRILDETARHAAEGALRAAEAHVGEQAGELEHRATQLARLTSELTLTEQRARKRLASILHDQLQQLLASARMNVKLLSGDGTDRAAAIERTVRCLDEAIDTTRTLSVELSPPLLHDFGLAAAFEWLAEWMREKHDLVLHVTADARGNPDSDDVRVLLFESVRELLFNTVKHAGVREAWLELAPADDDQLRVTVSDRGTGLEPSRLEAPSRTDPGLGLFTIRERLLSLGGSFQVESAPGQGARFTLLAPRHGPPERAPAP